jgi:alpha-L-fucosidase 2
MMRLTKVFAIAVFLLPAGFGGNTARAQTAHSRAVLWYRTPAPVWDNALPIGNGRLGAMVFGGANKGSNNGDLQASPSNVPLMNGSQTSGADEHLQLNESSLWRGSRADRLNPRAHEAVPEIRKLLLESKGLDGAKISAAEKMAQEDMIGIPPRMPG